MATLKPEDIAKVNRTYVRSFVPQAELNGEYVLSGYGAGGGLIGAIADSSVNSGRAKASSDRVQPVRDELKDVDLRLVYWQALSNAVCQIPWLKVEQFETRTSAVERVTARIAGHRPVLNIGSSYLLSQDCRVLKFKSGFDMYLPDRYGRAAAINFITYNSRVVCAEEGDQAIPTWAAGHGALFRELATEAVQENVKLMRYAIELMGGASSIQPRPAIVCAKFDHLRGDFGIASNKVKVKVTVLEETPERLLVQLKTRGMGQFFSLPRNEIEVEYLLPK